MTALYLDASIAELNVDAFGLLHGDGVLLEPIHPSWYYNKLSTPDGLPAAIVAHYTATNPGTALAMAHHRQRPLQLGDRQASWHVSIEADGAIVQMAPFVVGCWHAGGKTARPIPDLGPANRTAVGIELVGFGRTFPRAQVIAAQRVWRAVCQAYVIPRHRAMVTHQELDPGRKSDPGKVWMIEHADDVLSYAFPA